MMTGESVHLPLQAAPIPGPAGVLQRQMASGAVPSTLADVLGPTQVRSAFSSQWERSIVPSFKGSSI